MKTKLFPIIALLAGLAAAQDPTADTRWYQRYTQAIMNRHIEGVGLVVYGLDEEAWSDPGTTVLAGNARTPQGVLNSLFDPVLQRTDSELLLDRFVLIARVQNSLDVTEAEPQAATYQWVRDANAGSFWNLDAAVILDWYFAKNGLHLLEYAADQRAVHLRTGFAWEKMTAGGAALDVDIRELFVGIAFHPFPNNPDEFGAAQMQKMQFGIHHQDDTISDVSQTALTLNWKPFVKMFGSKFILGGKMDWNKLRKGQNQLEAAKSATAPGKSNVEPGREGEPQTALPAYVYLKPNFSLDSVLENARRAGAVNPGDYNISFGMRLGGGAFNDKFRYSYELTGLEPLEQPGQPRIFQELRLEYQPRKDWPMNVTARYVRGQRAPAYVSEDRLVLAVGLRF